MKLYKDTLLIVNDYSDCLKSNNLACFGKLLHEPVGKLIASEPNKDVRYLSLNNSTKTKGAYLKQVSQPGYKLRKLMKGRIVDLVCTREKKMLQTLYAHKLPVMNLIAWGERKLFGLIPVRGFILVDEVVGDEVVELFTKKSKQTRTSLMFAIGKLMGQLANIGFYYAPRLRDFIAAENTEGTYELVMIDREVGPKLRTCSNKKIYKFIAESYGKMRRLNQPLGAWESRAFVKGFYAEANNLDCSLIEFYRNCINAIIKLGADREKYNIVLKKEAGT